MQTSWLTEAARKAVDRLTRKSRAEFTYPADVDLFFDFAGEKWVARVGSVQGSDSDSPVEAFNRIGT